MYMEKREENLRNSDLLQDRRIETVLNTNLLTNYDDTLMIMKAIEGDGWLENRP